MTDSPIPPHRRASPKVAAIRAMHQQWLIEQGLRPVEPEPNPEPVPVDLDVLTEAVD